MTRYFDEIRGDFFQAIERLDSNANNLVRSAYKLAEQEHEGQLRKQHKSRPIDDRDPYLIHPLRVSLIVMNELRILDLTAILSAVLHDVVEDGINRPTLDDIKLNFGEGVSNAVGYLTKPDGAKGDELIPYHEALVTAPLHVRLVKLSDRLDNLREILLVSNPKFQNRYLKETRDIFIPLARLTSSFFLVEYEELCRQLESMLALN